MQRLLYKLSSFVLYMANQVLKQYPGSKYYDEHCRLVDLLKQGIQGKWLLVNFG